MINRFLLPLLILLWSFPLLAWRDTGHFAICDVAYKQLTPTTQKKIDAILEGKSFVKQCLWMDEIKKIKFWKYTKKFHMLNLEDNENYFTIPHKEHKGDALEALLNYKKDLTELIAEADELNLQKEQMKTKIFENKQKQLLDLRFITHIASDIHQPLHLGRASDRGANNIKVSWQGKVVTLHRFWDLQFVETYIKRNLLENQETEEPLYGVMSAQILAKTTPKQIHHYQSSPLLEWFQESLCLRTSAYNITGEVEVNNEGQSFTNLDEAYFEKNKDLVYEQIQKAGFRLAGLLNRLYDSEVTKQFSSLDKIEKSLTQEVNALLRGNVSEEITSHSLKTCN